MSQILVATKSGLIQDFVISKKRSFMTSTASFAKCNVCGKGIEDGLSITAKSIQKRTFFFCDIHNN